MTKTHPSVLFIALTLLPLGCSNSPKTDTATPDSTASAPPAPAPEPPARSWAAIAAGGVGVLSLGFLAGLLASRRGA